MGVSVWTFLRSKPGEIFPLAQRAMDDFLTNTGRLPPDEDSLVGVAQVIVNLENRRAVEILRIAFFQYRALKNGKLSRRHFREIMAVLPEAALGGLRLSKPPPSVVSAEHRFAKRRLDQLNTWKPTQGDLSKLRSLVNRKAGREIM
jgi:hypothetical protein